MINIDIGITCNEAVHQAEAKKLKDAHSRSISFGTAKLIAKSINEALAEFKDAGVSIEALPFRNYSEPAGAQIQVNKGSRNLFIIWVDYRDELAKGRLSVEYKHKHFTHRVTHHGNIVEYPNPLNLYDSIANKVKDLLREEIHDQLEHLKLEELRISNAVQGI